MSRIYNIYKTPYVIPKGIKLGQKVNIDHVHIYDASNVEIGDYTFVGRFTSIAGRGGVTIGHNCAIASHCVLQSTNHKFRDNVLIPFDDADDGKCGITIGDHCWLGDSVIVLPGVYIGKHCVIGAGSVVIKDVPPYSVAVGNPAMVIYERDASHLDYLEKNGSWHGIHSVEMAR